MSIASTQAIIPNDDGTYWSDGSKTFLYDQNGNLINDRRRELGIPINDSTAPPNKIGSTIIDDWGFNRYPNWMSSPLLLVGAALAIGWFMGSGRK